MKLRMSLAATSKSVGCLFVISLIVLAAAPTLGAAKKKAPAEADKAAAAAGDKAAPAEKAPAAAGDKAAPVSGAKKEVTLSGEMTCGKCGLGETPSCQNVLQVGDAAKGGVTKYYLVHNDVSKKAHGPVCSGSTKATVKGSVGDEGGKKVLTASEIKYQ